MPDKIMAILAEVTGGKSYKAHKYGLDHADRPFIDYGEDSIIWKKTAETDKSNRKYVPLEVLSKTLSAREEQRLTYFLDGSRRVFKVDDIAYTKSGGRKGKIGKGIEFFEEAFGRDLDEFYKILWMPETFIIYRRKYDKKLRERLADRYKNHSSEDCDLANEWWTKFCSLPAEKLEIAKSIISLNKFKEGDYDCTDKEILDVLSYYSITRDIAEQSI